MEKQKIKEEKKKIEQEKKKTNGQTCIAILKSGNRKGCACSVKVFNNNLCKRHFNLENKI
jgi:hypothetical protein